MDLRKTALLIVLLAAAVPGATAARASDDFTPLPAKTIAMAAGARDCASRDFTAPAEGFATFSLDGGAHRGDWDLSVADRQSGTRLGASRAFRADELVQAWMRSGQTVVLRACRHAGASRSVPGTIRFGVAAWPQAGPPVRLVHIPLTDTRRQVPVLEELGIDVDENVRPGSATATIFSDTELAKLTHAGFAPRVVNTDVLRSDQAVLAADARRSRTRSTGPVLPSGRTTYRQYEDYQSDLKKLVAEHPAFVRPVTLPLKTLQGRDQIGVELSDRVAATDDQKPTAFIMGEHHAREWPSAEAPMEFAIYLAQQFGHDKRVTRLLKRTRIVIVPIINVDGFIASRGAVDLADSLGDPEGLFSLGEAVLPPGGELAYRRKNCRGALPPSAPCELQWGVDDNRNYGFNWGGPGASSSQLSQTYRGTGQWSEPESESVHRFSQERDVTTLLTMHNFASLVLRPPSLAAAGLAPDEAELKRLGDAMAADTGYTSEYGYQLYDTSGTTEDWNYGAAGTFGYTIEMGPADTDGGNFHVAYQRAVVDQFFGAGKFAGKGLRDALLLLSEEATNAGQFSTLTGRTRPGRVLHLHRSFDTSTAPICQLSDFLLLNISGLGCPVTGAATSVPDHLDYRTTVGKTGRFTWLVTPSTRPFVHKAGKTETWTLTCESASGKVYSTQQIAIWRGERKKLSLPCGGRLS